MVDYIWIVVALPLLGAALLLLFGKRIGEPGAGYLATLLAAGAFVVIAIAAADFFAGGHQGQQVFLFDWIPGLGIRAEFLWDPLSAVMALVVAGVGLAHPPLLDRVHARRRALRALLRLPEPVPCIDAHSRARRQLRHACSSAGSWSASAPTC